jgi:hypothetical protein
MGYIYLNETTTSIYQRIPYCNEKTEYKQDIWTDFRILCVAVMVHFLGQHD